MDDDERITYDRTPGYVNQLTQVMDRMGSSPTAAANGFSEKVDHLRDAIDRSSRAAEKHARSLAYATWALVGATAVLVVVTGVHVYFSVNLAGH